MRTIHHPGSSGRTACGIRITGVQALATDRNWRIVGTAISSDWSNCKRIGCVRRRLV